jgi:hypothetical protein
MFSECIWQLFANHIWLGTGSQPYTVPIYCTAYITLLYIKSINPEVLYCNCVTDNIFQKLFAHFRGTVSRDFRPSVFFIKSKIGDTVPLRTGFAYLNLTDQDLRPNRKVATVL